MNDDRLRYLLHDTHAPEVDASELAQGARRVARRRATTRRTALAGVTGVAVVAVGVPILSQLGLGMGGSDMSSTAGGAVAPEVKSSDDRVTGVAADAAVDPVAACAAPSPPSGVAGPSDVVGLVVCSTSGPRELSSSDVRLVLTGGMTEAYAEGQVSAASGVIVLGQLASGTVVYLSFVDGRLDFGSQVLQLSPAARALLEAAAS